MAHGNAAPVDHRDRSQDRWLVLGLAASGLLALATIAAVAALLLFVALYSIPSSSNEPTLKVGDNVLAVCYRLGCRFGTLPFLPVITLLEPEMGDMAVFRKPDGSSIVYVKRIVGLPGDEVRVRDEVLYINGTAVPRGRIEDDIETDYRGTSRTIAQYEETLPNGVKAHVLDRAPNRNLDNVGPFKVPPDHYFVVGDNRDNSSDSRDPNGGVGYVPRENMVARVRRVTFSTAAWGRIFVPVDLPPQSSRRG